MTGGDRQSWLAGMLTCDIKPLRPGQGAYGLFVNKTGRVQAEAWVAIDAERILLAVRSELVEPVRQHLDAYLVMEDAELAVDDRYGWWLAHGPNAEAVAKAARRLGGVAALGQLAEIPTAILAVPHHASPNPSEELTAASGAVLATPQGWERVRIERMLPRWGVDFTAGGYPQEATLESLAVSFNKGCYVGQEAVFMLEKRGHVAKRLVRLVIDSDAEIAAGSEVAAADGAVVGAITSAVRDGGKVWAMASVRYKHTESGTELRVAGHPAKVSCLGPRESCG